MRLEQIEGANRELRAANAALARAQVGKRDSAAASLVARLDRAERELERMRRSISWRITVPLRVAQPLWRPLRTKLASLRDRLKRRRH